jgi:hypothetical protein
MFERMRLVNPVNRLVLWEQDIDKVVSASFYKLSRAVVREYEGDKYLTFNKKSTIEKTTANIERQDEVGVQRPLKSVECPAEGVVSLKRFYPVQNVKSRLQQ